MMQKAVVAVGWNARQFADLRVWRGYARILLTKAPYATTLTCHYNSSPRLRGSATPHIGAIPIERHELLERHDVRPTRTEQRGQELHHTIFGVCVCGRQHVGC